MKKIAMIIAPEGYQDTEFGVPYKYFTERKASVDVFSTRKGTACGKMGGTFNVEHSLGELNVGDYDAIVFVGGPGTPIVRKEGNSLRVAKDAAGSGKVLGAICWSPTILAMAGVLDGKKATVWNGEDPELRMSTSDYLEEKGAIYLGKDVAVDGKIVTANGPAAAQKYAEELWKKLS